MDNRDRTTVLALLFLSGFCSLVYQTLWVKQLSLVIGVDVYAIAIVVSGFFMGLGVGSYYFSRRAQDYPNPVLLYSRLEIATALCALCLLLLLRLGAELYVELDRAFGVGALAALWLLIAIPPFFMGGTFLALLRYCRSGPHEMGRFVGQLYGANTSGAVLGTLCTPFVLIPLVGVLGSGIVAVGVNLGLPMLARQLSGPRASSSSTHTPGPVVSGPRHWRATGLYGLVGFSAIAFEVIWGQMIIQFLNTRTHAYAVMLAVYLAGLALGNLLISRRVDRMNNLWLAFSIITFFAVATAVLPIALVNGQLLAVQESVGQLVFEATGQLSLSMLSRFLFISVFFIFLSTCCFGALLPIASKLVDDRQGRGTLATGHALAFNTFGGVMASLIFGFWVVPRFGLVNAVMLASMLLGVVALASLFLARFRWPFAVAYVAVVLLALLIPRDKFAQLLVEQEGGRLVYFAEGVGNTVAVIEQGNGNRQFRRLYIEGISNTGDVMASRRYMRLQTYIPLLLLEQPAQSALVIGLGTGITSGALLNVDSLNTRHVVELLPEVVEASRYFAGNYAVVESGDVEVSIGDGRHELLRGQSLYDLITLEPPPPTAAGVNNLYSSDFYALCKRRLTTGGALAQWWPLSTQSVDASRSMVRSMLDSFPYVTLWTTELHEMLLVGSLQPLPLDLQMLAERLEQQPAMAQSLIEVGINSPEALLATYMMDQEGLAAFAGSAPPITDDDPRLEYDRWTSKRVLLDILPPLLAGQTTLDNVPAGSAAGYRFEQEKLLAFYYAGLASYAGDQDTWREMMKRLNRADQDNRYYAWFRGDG